MKEFKELELFKTEMKIADFFFLIQKKGQKRKTRIFLNTWNKNRKDRENMLKGMRHSTSVQGVNIYPKEREKRKQRMNDDSYIHIRDI